MKSLALALAIIVSVIVYQSFTTHIYDLAQYQEEYQADLAEWQD
jgi:hypothetical protein